MNKNKYFTIVLFVAALMTTFTLTSFTSEFRNDQRAVSSISSDQLSGAGVSAAQSDVIRKLLFNFNALDSILNVYRQRHGWADGELTMFRDNCKKYLLDESPDPRRFVIIINETTGDIRINGRKDLHEIFETLGTFADMSKKSKLYRQVFLALEEAENLGIYDLVFKEIKEPVLRYKLF